jgi:hypothetical protein
MALIKGKESYKPLDSRTMYTSLHAKYLEAFAHSTISIPLASTVRRIPQDPSPAYPAQFAYE